MTPSDPDAPRAARPDRSHTYRASVRWTGNRGTGTVAYDSYDRDHTISAPGKPDLLASADPQYRGDRSKYNPEELLVASLSACHMLWYLHLCAVGGVQVVRYEDQAEGVLGTEPDGSGRFTGVTLRPQVVVGKGDLERARTLHEKAHRMCFVASSVNFPVKVEPKIVTEARAEAPS
jgi:organic hydroperoxide reductase OsmC/OhrA